MSALLNAILKESASSAVNGAFDELLRKQINIEDGIRSKASDSQNHLRDFLSSEYQNDQTFPSVLSVQDRDFLGGSFARHTKIWPLDDIDIYFPLDGYSLNYLQDGLRLPYTVVSDGVLSSNPLLTARWMSGSYISSRKLISGLSAVLQRHYPRTDVRPDGEAVRIAMAHGETEDEDGLGFDVVPCFLMRPDAISEAKFYLIPDGQDGWIRTNPKVDKEIANKLHQNNARSYKKAIKILKFWNKEALNGALQSYYVELAIARRFLDSNSAGNYAAKVSEAVAFAFYAVNVAISSGSLSSFVNQAPLVSPGDVSDHHRFIVNKMAGVARLAFEAEQVGNQDQAIELWRQIFGETF
jgi:hypothetical protein